MNMNMPSKCGMCDKEAVAELTEADGKQCPLCQEHYDFIRRIRGMGHGARPASGVNRVLIGC